MPKDNQFIIQNDTPSLLIVNLEPECVHVPLAAGEMAMVCERYETQPLTLKMELDDGEIISAVWPGDGVVRVEKDGVDVLSGSRLSIASEPLST